MLQLRINQQYAQIGINTSLPQINLHSTLPRVEIQTTPASMEIGSPRPVLHIDQSQCFAEAGLKSNETFLQDLVAQAKSDVAEGTAAIANEGDQLARIIGPSLGDVITNRWPKSQEFTMVSMPASRPRISFETYPIDFSFSPAMVDVHLNRGMVDSNLDWGKVELYMLQKNSIKMYCTEAQLMTFA